MRTWVKVMLGVMAAIAVAIAVLGGTGAYFVFRNMNSRTAGDAEAAQAFDAVRARFGARPPLVEIVEPQRGDIRINRPAEVSPTRVATIHIINWKSDTRELSRTEVPLWLTRFSSVNILSQLGVAPAKFRLTVDDIQRYGPGVIVDYAVPGSFRVLLWVE